MFSQPDLRDNEKADIRNLAPFYANVSAAIRAVVPDAKSFAIAYEPSWPVGDQDIHPESLLSPTSGFGALPDTAPVYAFHYYAPPCDTNFSRYLEMRLADATRLKAAPYLSELNLSAWDTPSTAAMAATLGELESRGVAYTGWQYKSYAGSLPNGTCTGCGNSFFEDSGAANNFMFEAMARPIAHAVAGSAVTGHAAGGTLDGDNFELVLRCTGEGPTEIVVPHLWAATVAVQVAGDSDAVVLQTPHAGGNVAPGVQNAGWTFIAIKHSPVAKDGIVTVTVSR